MAGEAGQSFLWNQLPAELSRPQGGGEAEGWDPMEADSCRILEALQRPGWRSGKATVTPDQAEIGGDA